jgi:hypothetical protein
MEEVNLVTCNKCAATDDNIQYKEDLLYQLFYWSCIKCGNVWFDEPVQQVTTVFEKCVICGDTFRKTSYYRKYCQKEDCKEKFKKFKRTIRFRQGVAYYEIVS